MAGRLAVVVPAVGLAGGLVKLLPVVPRAVELAEAVFCADEAVPAIADDRDEVAAVGRLGAAEVAGVAFFVGATFSGFFAADALAVSGFFGVSTFSTGASRASGATVATGASGSDILE